MFLLPSKGHPANLRRFLNTARELGTSSPGLVLINQEEFGDPAYEECKALAPPGWEFLPVAAQTYGDALRAAWPRVKDLPWVGLVADDLVPCTSGWDRQLISGIQGWNFISSNDGWQAPHRMHGATVFSGDLLRAVGWLFPEGLDHIFHDDVWETIGRETGCWSTRMDIMVKHLHEALEGVRGPAMDPTSDLWKHDEAWFTAWRDGGEKDRCVARIRELMSRYGVRSMTPDYAGVSLMLGTPTLDGRYESSYVVALFQTIDMMKQLGVAIQWAEEKYTADVSLARAKVFSAFYRSNASHLLMVDADMGWDLNAVNRLFCAKKDIVAVAGPKKRYPLQFAANYTDVLGNPIPLEFDNDTGTMRIGEIGCAFMMITRGCAEKMVQAHPELEYVGVTGEKEWALFNPFVDHARYYSEDFGFCKRWRNLGGEIFMIPDVGLKHTGPHQFEGKFSELLAAPPQVPALKAA